MTTNSKILITSLLTGLLTFEVMAQSAHGAAAYTTIDDPLGIDGTEVYGVSGNNVVGTYQDSTGTHGFLYNGTSYITLTDPSGINDASARAVDGNNVLESYSGGTFIYNIASGTYTALNLPGPANGISGNQIVGSYSGPYYSNGNQFQGVFAYNYDLSTETFTTLYPVGGEGSLELGMTYYNVYEGISGNNAVGIYATHTSLNSIMPGPSFTYFSSESQAYGISGNEIVGTFEGFFDGEYILNGNSYLYDFSTGNISIFNIDGYNTTAYGIDGTNIVGTYQDNNGVNNGFIMSVYDVPEPSTFALTTVYAGCFVFSAFRRRVDKIMRKA